MFTFIVAYTEPQRILFQPGRLGCEILERLQPFAHCQPNEAGTINFHLSSDGSQILLYPNPSDIPPTFRSNQAARRSGFEVSSSLGNEANNLIQTPFCERWPSS